MTGRVKRILTVALLASVAIALSGCGGSNSKAPSQDEQTPASASSTDVYACLMKSDVASLVTDVSYEADPLNDYNSFVWMVKTTVEPGQYEGDNSGSAVLLATELCGATGAIAVIDRDGNDMGQ